MVPWLSALVLMASLLAAGHGLWSATWLAAAALLAGQLALHGGMARGAASRAALVPAPAANRIDDVAAGLQRQHERASCVLEALGESVLVADDRGRILLANATARRLARRQRRELTGSLLWEVLPDELGHRVRDAWQALHSGMEQSAEALPQIRYPAIPCRDAIYDLTAVRVMEPDSGRDHGCAFLIVDSTRCHELQRLKDRFLSTVSHELRTPLTNICAYAEILRSLLPGESAEWPEFVRVIHEEGLQLSRLVDGMFDYLQLESGEAVFRNRELDGSSLVAAVVQRLQEVAARRGIQLEFADAIDAPRVHADAARLDQVVNHLVDNAIKFTPDAGRVLVRSVCRDDAFELRVEDSGPGVPPQARRQVFEKFHQLPDHLTDKPTGAGLGLATSRAIVARLGGMIWCEDSALGGACFVVLLPGVGQPRLAAAGAMAGGGY